MEKEEEKKLVRSYKHKIFKKWFSKRYGAIRKIQKTASM